MRIGLAAAAAFIVFTSMQATPAAAQQSQCFEQHYVEAGISCSHRDRPNSADFEGGCTWHDARWVHVEVQCPPGRWVNIEVGYSRRTGESTAIVHQAACAMAGLRPAYIDGQICATGRHRPTTGEGWDSIVYRRGTTGPAGRGGDTASITEPPVPTPWCHIGQLPRTGWSGHVIPVAWACQ